MALYRKAHCRLEVRHDFEDLIVDGLPEMFEVPTCSAKEGIAYIRHDELRIVLVVGNPCEEEILVTLNEIPGNDGEWTDRIDGVTCRLGSGEMSLKLRPWQCLVFTQDRSKRSAAKYHSPWSRVS